MPWKAVKKNGKVVIKKKDTGKTVGHSDSMEQAMKAIAARYESESSKKK